MSYSNPLIVQVHLAGAEPYQLGDVIWQHSLRDVIRVEAESVANHAGPDLLTMPSPAAGVALRDRIVAEMTAALQQIGDTYTAPDSVGYTLTGQAPVDLPVRQETLATRVPSRQLRSSRRFFASTISRSAHPPRAPQSCAGATKSVAVSAEVQGPDCD